MNRVERRYKFKFTNCLKKKTKAITKFGDGVMALNVINPR